MHWVIFFLFHTFYLELVLLNEKFRKKRGYFCFSGGVFCTDSGRTLSTGSISALNRIKNFSRCSKRSLSPKVPDTESSCKVQGWPLTRQRSKLPAAAPSPILQWQVRKKVNTQVEFQSGGKSGEKRWRMQRRVQEGRQAGG